MKVLIIEDELLSAEHLIQMLHKIDPNITILGIADSIKKSKVLLKEHPQIDLLFLDIHLADGLSFDLFEDLQFNIPVIFTTAYHEYAIQSFEVNNIDYLLKPIGKNDLEKAIEKFKKLQQYSTQSIQQLLPLLEQNLKSYKSRFLVKLGEHIHAINESDIHHFIAEDGIVLLVTNQGKRYPVDYTLDQLEQLINPKIYFRINRKVLIQLPAIQKLSSYFNSRLKIQTEFLAEDACVVSRERVSEFKTWMEG